jgi:hypothetical protein
MAKGEAMRGGAVVAGLAVGVASAAVVVRTAERRWQRASDGLLARLRSHQSRSAATFCEQDLAGLPAPVERYFRHTLRAGQRIITHARIRWEGQFNMGQPDKENWRPFTAVQDFVPGAPGFMWNARITMVPGVPIFVRDSFVDGRGSMRGAVLGLVPIVGVEGTPTVASGALQRYLGEAAWLPTALLPRQGVSWTAIDEARALATITAGGTTVSLQFRFDGEGRNVSVFAPDRFYDDGRGEPVARPWEARSLRFGELEGMVVATEAVAEWHLPSGTFTYWRGRPTKIEYSFSAPE